MTEQLLHLNKKKFVWNNYNFVLRDKDNHNDDDNDDNDNHNNYNDNHALNNNYGAHDTTPWVLIWLI